jgi:uncharacterized heparinase superfamily protein
MSLSRWYHTIRPLRGRQVAAQIRTRLARWSEDPAAFAKREAPPFPGARLTPAAPFLPPAGRVQARAELLAGRFTFLNRSESVGFPPDWRHAAAPRLWLYNLHYFEYLFDLDWDSARAAVADWIEKHPLARGQVGWEPYPTSLRLVDWCAFFFGEHAARTRGDAGFRDRLWRSLHLQAEWLAAHLETHLLGNHLLENAAALLFCGLCFEGEAARRWQTLGRGLLEAELAEQVLADGGHVERSPMYQLRVIWVLLALRNAGGAALAPLLDARLAALLEAAAQLRHPDGEIALWNDSAFGVYPRVDALREGFARATGRALPEAGAGSFALRETGYFGARSRLGDYVVCDAGPIGPDYQPGHGHGDLFAFEASFGGRRVFTDAGVFGYEDDALRAFCRATRAHNTVEVDGESQCEFWSVFRVARRARPHDVRFEALPDGFRLEAWHDGYRRLPARARHRRRFRWHERGLLMLADELEGAAPFTARARLHLHPDCAVEALGRDTARIRHPGGVLQLRFAGPGELALEPSRFCPEFGVVRERRALVYQARGKRLAFGVCIANGAEEIGYDLASGASVPGAKVGW